MKEMTQDDAFALAKSISKRLDSIESQAVELLRWAATHNLNLEPFRETVKAITEAWKKSVAMRPETLKSAKE